MPNRVCNGFSFRRFFLTILGMFVITAPLFALDQPPFNAHPLKEAALLAILFGPIIGTLVGIEDWNF